ncbi:polysaccharide pyruvyl transferase family protein [Bifidobacterium sp. 82T25]|nr:polysaccharide pyruvyl transferase family protein [Bifidobacterium miconisargentati]
MKPDAVHGKAFYLVCEPGYPNYGDELIAAEWLKYLAETHPETPVFLDCTRPGPASVILRGLHPHCTIVDTISRITFENTYADGDISRGAVGDIAGFVHGVLENEGMAARYASGVHLLRDGVKGVHFLGGGYMNGKWTANLARLELGSWAHEHGITVLGTGAGIMPLTDDSLKYVRETIPQFDRFSVRDESSYEALQGAGNVTLAPDDCFVNGLEGCYAPAEGLPEVMICVQSDLVDDADALYNHIFAMLEAWNVGPQDSIGVVECNPYLDRPIFDKMEEAGFSPVFFPTTFLLECGFPAREGQRWITTRYHPHILAAAKGCSGVYVCVNKEYYGVKHKAVTRMGSRWAESVIGESVPQPGEGFADLAAPAKFASQIREYASVLYGLS